MNVSRRIHCLRAHRPKTSAYPGENWHNSFGCKHWCENEQTTVRVLYTLIVMVILIAVWGVWARDSLRPEHYFKSSPNIKRKSKAVLTTTS